MARKRVIKGVEEGYQRWVGGGRAKPCWYTPLTPLNLGMGRTLKNGRFSILKFVQSSNQPICMEWILGIGFSSFSFSLCLALFLIHLLLRFTLYRVGHLKPEWGFYPLTLNGWKWSLQQCFDRWPLLLHYTVHKWYRVYSSAFDMLTNDRCCYTVLYSVHKW